MCGPAMRLPSILSGLRPPCICLMLDLICVLAFVWTHSLTRSLTLSLTHPHDIHPPRHTYNSPSEPTIKPSRPGCAHMSPSCLSTTVVVYAILVIRNPFSSRLISSRQFHTKYIRSTTAPCSLSSLSPPLTTHSPEVQEDRAARQRFRSIEIPRRIQGAHDLTA